MAQHVMTPTQKHEVFEIGVAAICPVLEVMSVGPFRGTVTARE